MHGVRALIVRQLMLKNRGWTERVLERVCTELTSPCGLGHSQSRHAEEQGLDGKGPRTSLY